MKRKTLLGAVGFLAVLSLSLLAGGALIGILAFASWHAGEELIGEIHHSVKEFAEEYSPVKWPPGAWTPMALSQCNADWCSDEQIFGAKQQVLHAGFGV
jgi:hypothetical protein